MTRTGRLVEGVGWLVFVLPTYVVWFLVIAEHLALGHTGFVVAMVAAFVGTVVAGADVVARVKAVTRLREHGVTTDALLGQVEERYVHVPSGYSGWVTTVEVTFTDKRGALVHASYADHARARGRKQGQTTQVVYDPRRPTAISPVGASGAPDDPRWFEAFLMGWGTVTILAISIYFSFRAFG